MTDTQTTRHDGWTPTRERQFLEALAREGYVNAACKAVGISREAAYELRHRAAGLAFAYGWDAALLLARVRLADELMERAIAGQEDVFTRDDDAGERRRRRHDNRLAMSLLGRLDKFHDARRDGAGEAGGDAAAPSPHAEARLIAQDWETFLDMIADGHGNAGAALFLAARRPDAANLDETTNGPCQLCRDDAAAREAEASEIAPEAEPEPRWRIWWSDWGDEPLTNFPPPDDYYDDGEYNARPYDEGYARKLTEEERAIVDALEDLENQPLVDEGTAERDAYFAAGRAKLEAAGVDLTGY